MSALLPVVNNPVVQTVGMSLFKNLIMSFGKKSSGSDNNAEVAELKKQVEHLIKDKDERIKDAINDKNEVLKRTNKVNEMLSNQVSALQMELRKEKDPDSLSEDLLRERQVMLDKMNALERELENIRLVKESKEQEVLEIQKTCEQQKKDNKELMDTVTAFAKLNNSPDSPSTSTDVDANEVLSKLLMLLVQEEVTSEPTKKKNKKKNKVQSENLPKQNNQDANPVNTTGQYEQQYRPGMAGPSNMGNSTNSVHGPNMGLNPNMSSYPNMGPHPNVGLHPNMGSYPNMGPYPNMGVQSNMTQYPNAGGPPPGPYSPNTYSQPPLLTGVPLIQDAPHNYQRPPPLMNFSSAAPPTQYNNVPYNYNQNYPSFQHNRNKPNDLGSKKNLTKISNRPDADQSDDKHRQDGDSKTSVADKDKMGKSGPPVDLWGRLDQLKDDIKTNKSSKSKLMSQIPILMSEAAKSSITSKDKFLDELSECVKKIHCLPDGSGDSNYHNRRNFRPDYKQNFKHGEGSRNRGTGYGERNRGRGFHYQKRHAEGRSNKNSDEDNWSDDASSICSESCNNNYRGRGRGGRGRGWKQDGGGGRGGERPHYYNQRRSSQAESNRNSDENDSDGATSVKSERGGTHFRGRGRGRGGGWNRGRGGFKPGNRFNPKNPSTKPADVEVAQEALDPSPVRTCLQTVTPSQVAQPPQPVPRLSKMSTSQPAPIEKNDLIDFDSGEDQLPKATASYASKKTMKKFIGTEIPSLMDSLMNKIDVTLKVKNCLVAAVKDGEMISETPDSLLDIIQFKLTYPDAVCVYESEFKNLKLV